MPISISNRTRSKVDKEMLTKTAESFLKLKKLKDKEVSLVLVGDTLIRQLNNKYRGKDRVTDVLSFYETQENNGFLSGDFLGEVIINLGQVKRQAKIYNNTADAELKFVLVHGLLHLLGVRDYSKKEKENMDNLTRELIKQIDS